MNYKKLNLKIGLEVHQQLESSKLFCNCPSIITNEEPDFKIKRFLRASAGEVGEIDIAAKFEELKNKQFIYEVYNKYNCLIEIDEEPPNKVNTHALKIALEISLLLNARIIDNIQIMRKIVVDGSNVAGFQKSMLVARGGFIETPKGKVGIETICLEEDAARIIKQEKELVVYRLDRLGIPLVEIATAPDIKDPEHAKETAQKIGMILRSTEKVKRGIGTIRQDVNLSVNNMPRVEIKGFQDLRSIPIIIKNEIERQLKTKLTKPEVRKANSDLTTSFLRPMPSASRMYPETDIPTIRITKKMLDKIKLPELLTDVSLKIQKRYKINEEIANLIIKDKINLEHFVQKFTSIEPSFIAQTLTLTIKDIKNRLGLNTSKITQKHLEEIFSYYNNKKISKEAVSDMLIEVAKGNKIDISRFQTISEKELEEELKKLIHANKDLTFGAYMGLAMKKFRGKIDGKKIAETLKKLTK